jgi:hypothetical protein
MPDTFFNGGQIVYQFLIGKHNSASARACTRGTSDTVDIIFRILGHIVIDYVGYIVDMNSA